MSTGKQARRETPIETQDRICREVSAAHDGEITAPPYVESAKSGRLPPRQRPELNSALEDARAGLDDRLILFASDRISRDADLTGWARTEFSWAGVIVESAQSFGAPRTQRHVEAIAADIEWTMIRERTLEAMHTGGLACKRRSGAQLYGLRWLPDNLSRVPVPEEAADVLAMFEERARGIPPCRIADSRGWRRQRVYELLRHPAYIGVYAWVDRKGLPHWTEGRWEPIIPRSLWDHVQALLRETSERQPWRNPGQAVLPLTGLLLCDHCGRRMVLGQTIDRESDQRRYRCPDGHVSVLTQGWPESMLQTALRHLAEPDMAARMADALNLALRTGEDRGRASEAVRSLERQERSLTSAIVSGELLDPTDLARQLGDVQRRLRAARASLRDADDGASRLMQPQAIQRRIGEILEAASVGATREVLHAVLRAACVRDRDSGYLVLREPGLPSTESVGGPWVPGKLWSPFICDWKIAA